MEITKPIKPNEDKIVFDDYQLDKIINKINQAISTREWHHQIFPLKDDVGEWEAVIINFDITEVFMNKVVDIFKGVGWDCKFLQAYDARGPHQCFYVNKKHFV